MIPSSRRPSPATLKSLSFLLAALPLLFSSCSQHRPDVIDVVVHDPNAYQENFGPFDENGNYIESWADNPPKRRYISAAEYQQQQQKKSGSRKQQVAKYTPPPQPQPRQVATYTPPPKPSSYTPPKPKTVSKPKPVTVKPKKPAPRTHTVRKGDTLYGLARKYGTSVSSIQKANRISGSNIRIGQKLTIPR